MAIPAALARPEIIKALDISEEQREKIRTLSDRMEKRQFSRAARSPRPQPQGTPPEGN